MRYEVRRVYGPQKGTHGVYDTVTHTWVHLRGLSHMTEAEALEVQQRHETASVTATMPLDSENARIALNMARLLDHTGDWTPPFPITEVITCRGGDRRWDHKLFASSRVHPGDNPFQALTLCGYRALEIPGHGSEVDCPECLAVLLADNSAHGTNEAALIAYARATGIDVVTGSSAARQQEAAPVRHNHVTRDIKQPGACPACDAYHASQSGDPAPAGDGFQRVSYEVDASQVTDQCPSCHSLAAPAGPTGICADPWHQVPHQEVSVPDPPPAAGAPYLDGDYIVKNWHHKGP